MDYEAKYEGYRGVSYVKSFYIFYGFQVAKPWYTMVHALYGSE